MRKTITVVFSDVVGSTALGEQLDPESLRRSWAATSRDAPVLERHGGTVEKFIGDAVMAVFGIPVMHEDDALRAVRAAAEMRDALRPLNDELERERGVRIQVRVGVNTGEVVAGDGSGGQRFATGDAVNVAARLEQAAQPGEILVGESTYRLVRDAVTVEPVVPLALKGKGQAVAAVRLLAVPGVAAVGSARRSSDAATSSSFSSSAFDGVVRDRACRLVTVLGSAGVGKSRLVEEFLGARPTRRRSARPLPLLRRGHHVLADQERDPEAAGLSGEESPQAAREKIRSLVEAAPDADLIVERVAEAIGVAESVPGQRGISWAIGRFFEELAHRRPLVVVFDDIHWGEPTFLDLVETVAEQSREAPILLLCMARPELLEVRPGLGRGNQNATRLLLDATQRRSVGPPDHEPARRARARRGGAHADRRDGRGESALRRGDGRDARRQGVAARRNGSLAARASGRRSPCHPRFRLCSPPASTGSDATSGRSSSEARSRARSFIAAQSSRCRPGATGRRSTDAENAPPAGVPSAGPSQLRRRAGIPLPPPAAARRRVRVAVQGGAGRATRAVRRLARREGRRAGGGVRGDPGPSPPGGVSLQGRPRPGRRAWARAGRRAHTASAAPARAPTLAATCGARRKLLSSAVALLPEERCTPGSCRSSMTRSSRQASTRRTAMSWASIRCFWHRPLGHRWEFRQRSGKAMMRCARCGSVRRHRGPIGPDTEFTLKATRGWEGGSGAEGVA